MQLSCADFTHATGKWWFACSGAGLVSVATADTMQQAYTALRKQFGDIEWNTGLITIRPHRDALIALLDGTIEAYSLPVDIRGTELQVQVWKILARIPYGNTITYAGLAKCAGKPSAVRAVANACGANPVPIAIPCHRVIGSDKTLKGYALGLDVKKRLLDHEHLHARTSSNTMLETA